MIIQDQAPILISKTYEEQIPLIDSSGGVELQYSVLLSTVEERYVVRPVKIKLLVVLKHIYWVLTEVI